MAEFNININVTGDSFGEFVHKFLETMFPEPEVYTGTEKQQAYLKFMAEMLLATPERKLVIPTADEWVGLNLLEYDSELRRHNNAAKTKPYKEKHKS